MDTIVKLAWTLVFVALQPALPSATAKVVVFLPSPGTSHVLYHSNVARATAKLGHEVWVCIPEYLARHRIDTAGINVLAYGETLGDVEKDVVAQTRVHDSFFENRTLTITGLFTILKAFEEVAYQMLKEGLADKIKAVKPNLIVLDNLPFVKMLYVIPYKLEVPFAVIGNTYDPLGYGIPFSPAATPIQITVPIEDALSFWVPYINDDRTIQSGTASDNMDFSTRLQSAVIYLYLTVGSLVLDLLEADAVTRFASERPYKSLNDVLYSAEIYIIELDPIMDYPRPMLPNTKMIGGTAAKDAKPLKEPFKGFIENAPNGVILVSFGSTLAHIPKYIVDKISGAGKDAGLHVVFRAQSPSSDPDRILTKEWIPQNDIMGHPKTKLFISHCGKNGQYEALYHQVPILCMPVWGDQYYNAERVRAKGYGMTTDMRFATREDLTTVITQLIYNGTYKARVTKASKLFRLLYKSPMKEAAFWLDHVMEFGGDYMRAASQKMPLYKFLMLDVIAVILLVVIVAVLTLVILIRACLRFLSRQSFSKSKCD